jgi:hypothetical protein
MGTTVNGTVGFENNIRSATEFRAFQRGIHLGLSNFAGGTQEGVDRIDPTAVIRSGCMVTMGSRGYMQASGDIAGREALGIAKWDSDTLSESLVVDEELVFGAAGDSIFLRRLGADANSLIIRSVQMDGLTVGATNPAPGTTFIGPPAGTDYTFANGAVTHVATGSIPVGTTVYATYKFPLTAKDFEFEGLPFNAQFGNNMTTYQAGRLTVIKGRVDVFTTEWETNRDYALMAPVYCSANGQFTSDPGTARVPVGRVIQLPFNGSGYMGIAFKGDMA